MRTYQSWPAGLEKIWLMTFDSFMARILRTTFFHTRFWLFCYFGSWLIQKNAKTYLNICGDRGGDNLLSVSVTERESCREVIFVSLVKTVVNASQ